MNKVVYNSCSGGFGLSEKASNYLIEKYGIDINPKYGFLPDGMPRHDERLIEVIELMGDDANGFCAKLKIHETQSKVYRIDEYDGYESVETPDLIDWVVIE